PSFFLLSNRTGVALVGFCIGFSPCSSSSPDPSFFLLSNRTGVALVGFCMGFSPCSSSSPDPSFFFLLSNRTGVALVGLCIGFSPCSPSSPDPSFFLLSNRTGVALVGFCMGFSPCSPSSPGPSFFFLKRTGVALVGFCMGAGAFAVRLGDFGLAFSAFAPFLGAGAAFPPFLLFVSAIRRAPVATRPHGVNRHPYLCRPHSGDTYGAVSISFTPLERLAESFALRLRRRPGAHRHLEARDGVPEGPQRPLLGGRHDRQDAGRLAHRALPGRPPPPGPGRRRRPRLQGPGLRTRRPAPAGERGVQPRPLLRPLRRLHAGGAARGLRLPPDLRGPRLPVPRPPFHHAAVGGRPPLPRQGPPPGAVLHAQRGRVAHLQQRVLHL